MKVDSSMNAPSPSIASGDPNTSPTYFENDDQFIPNSNSWTMPVAVPIAKLIRKSDAEEADEPLPLLVLRAVGERLHDRQQRREPERQRHEREVVERRRRELPARQRKSVCNEGAHATLTRAA